MNAAIILAGGTGTRTGLNFPKQFVLVNDKPIIQYCYDTVEASKHTDAVVVVCEECYDDVIKNAKKELIFARPGQTRQGSIINALEVLKDKKPGTVMIYDSARPYVTVELIDSIYNALDGHDGVMPVLAMKDTVYECNDGKITGLLNRDVIFAGQAPELFVFDKYFEANRALTNETLAAIRGSSEPALLYGMDVVTVAGDEKNKKITTKTDIEELYESLSLK